MPYSRPELESALKSAQSAGDAESVEAITKALGAPPSTEHPLTEAERERSGMGQRFLAGIAEGTGVPAAMELVGPQSVQDFINQSQRDRARGLGGDTDIAGGVGQAIGFLGTLPLGGAALKGIASAAKAGKLAAPVGTAAERVTEALTGKRIRDYAAQGALASAMTPMEQEGESPWATKAEQLGAGAAVGGAMRPVVAGVTGGTKWATEKAAEIVNAYRPGDAGAERVIRKAFQQIASPAEREEVAAMLESAARDPRFAGMLSEQVLRSEKMAPTLVKLMETERVQAVPTHAAYAKQEADILGGGRTWLEGVRGEPNLLVQEKADKEALKKAFESAKKAPVLVDARQISGLLKKELASTKPTESVKDPLTGLPITGPKGEAVQYPGAGVVASDLNKSLQILQDKLITKDSPKQFMERLQRVATDELPDSPNIKVKGYANKLRAIINEIGKGDDASAALNELKASIKQAKMANDEIGRAVASVSKKYFAGPSRLTDSPSTIIQVREEARKMLESTTGHDATVLRGVMKQMDAAVGQAVPELKTALSQRVVAGESLNKRKVAEALLEASGGKKGEVPTPKNLIEALNEQDFVRKVTGGFKPEEETFAKYFPQNQADLERLSRVSRGVAGYIPEPVLKSSGTLAGRTDEEVMHMLNQPLTILSNVGKFAAKRLESPVDRTMLRLQQNPEQMASFLRDVPRSAMRKSVEDVVNSIVARQTARAAAPRAVAGQY